MHMYQSRQVKSEHPSPPPPSPPPPPSILPPPPPPDAASTNYLSNFSWDAPHTAGQAHPDFLKPESLPAATSRVGIRDNMMKIRRLTLPADFLARHGPHLPWPKAKNSNSSRAAELPMLCRSQSQSLCDGALAITGSLLRGPQNTAGCDLTLAQQSLTEELRTATAEGKVEIQPNSTPQSAPELARRKSVSASADSAPERRPCTSSAFTHSSLGPAPVYTTLPPSRSHSPATAATAPTQPQPETMSSDSENVQVPERRGRRSVKGPKPSAPRSPARAGTLRRPAGPQIGPDGEPIRWARPACPENSLPGVVFETRFENPFKSWGRTSKAAQATPPDGTKQEGLTSGSSFSSLRGVFSVMWMPFSSYYKPEDEANTGTATPNTERSSSRRSSVSIVSSGSTSSTRVSSTPKPGSSSSTSGDSGCSEEVVPSPRAMKEEHKSVNDVEHRAEIMAI